jgi:hypothetical protein
MAELVPITETLSVVPLLDLVYPSFTQWYSWGVWWAIYGDQQGDGPVHDTYLIDNVSRSIENGWYADLHSEQSAASGFYLGMVHGGMIDPSTSRLRSSKTMVVLTDLEFQTGYESGRARPYDVSDIMFMRLLHAYALKHPLAQNLAYDLGTVVGSISGNLLPLKVLSV